MKQVKLILAFLIFLLCPKISHSQEMGLSFSYFIPKNGYFSTPISPFSIRGVGIDLNDYVALQTGFSLYRMSGLNVKDMEGVTSKKPIVGPNFTVMVPVELVLQFVGQQQEFRVKGGAFGFYGFDNKINYGNLDAAIREYESWDVANAEVSADNKPGWGYFFGAEYVIFVTRQWGLSLEGNYYLGDASFALSGSYLGGVEDDELVRREFIWRDSKLDFTGLELSIGIIMTP